MESTSETAGDERVFSNLLEDDSDSLWLLRLSRLSSCGLSVFLRLSAAEVCIFTFSDDPGTDEEVSGDERESAHSLPTLPILLHSSSIFAGINFAT